MSTSDQPFDRRHLTKISACHERRFQFVFRFPQVFCYQMHHAIFRLDCAANTEKAHRLCQYGITLKDTFPNDNVDESRLILRHRVSGRCRQITKITRAMMAKGGGRAMCGSDGSRGKGQRSSSSSGKSSHLVYPRERHDSAGLEGRLASQGALAQNVGD